MTIGKSIALAFGIFILFSFHDKRVFANLGHSKDLSEKAWVDSVFQRLTLDERLGQLFVIRAHSDKDAAYEKEVEDLIVKFKPGGICFFNPTHTGTPEKQAELNNRYQSRSDQLPLMVSMDLEHGLGMRHRETTISYPKHLMLGAIRDNALIYEMGREIARQCRRLGVHVNFAPVADINNNPDNPVINERSFGEDRNNVTAKAYQYMVGLQDGGVMACAKHFPGHGDTDVDSHYDLPVLNYSRRRLDSLELYPFRMLSQNGVGSFMIAHLSVPAIDARPNRPTSLSQTAIRDILQKEIGFEGLIFTDGMGMQGVTKHFAPGEADVEAFRAGNDVDLLPESIEAAIIASKKALAEGTLDSIKVFESVKKVLRAKYRLGLTTPQRVELQNLRADLNTPTAFDLKRRLIENAVTLVRDDAKLTGFPDLENTRIATLALGDTNRTTFQDFCGFYAPVAHHNAGKDIDTSLQNRLLRSLDPYDVVLVSIHATRSRASDKFGLTDSQLDLIRRLNRVTTVCVTMFGNPYSLRYFDEVPMLVEAFTEDPMVQEVAAQAIFGALPFKGILPVTSSARAKYAQGLATRSLSGRMAYAQPEQVGLHADTLALMNDLVREMIASGATPGCQILVAKDGKVVWQKAYGHHTYEQTRPVRLDDLYDLASVTKVAASTLSLMHLYEAQPGMLDQKMSHYVPELIKTNKKDLTVREILAHHAGLQDWVAFYKQTLTPEKVPDPKLYRPLAEKGFEVPVTQKLFLKNTWVDSIWQKVYDSPLRENKQYKYSDLGFYLGAKAIEKISGLPVDQYADKVFYRPLGLSSMTYNPWKKGWTTRCVPTEEDGYFRYQRVQGYVHDMGAAMLGGVSGHAGLFSNASDLAVLFQMLLDGGTYGGKRYLKAETVRTFTTRYAGSTRRGIGFDMKELAPGASLNMSKAASDKTFGHTGFTGICAWADPDKRLIFIFLSNRTYPNMENNKLINGDWRPRLHDVVYRAIKK
jgi:beta-N-acetylhexosaminidase